MTASPPSVVPSVQAETPAKSDQPSARPTAHQPTIPNQAPILGILNDSDANKAHGIAEIDDTTTSPTSPTSPGINISLHCVSLILVLSFAVLT